MEEGQEKLVEEPVYIVGLKIHGVNGFKKKNKPIYFTDEEGKPCMWNVLLGNNNTGKTTLLRCIAGCIPSKKPINYNRKLFHLPLYSDITSTTRNHFKFHPQEISTYTIEENIRTYFSTGSFIGFGSNGVTRIPRKLVISLKIDAYGTQRKQGKAKIIDYELKNSVESLFSENPQTLIDAEEWIIGENYDKLDGNEKAGENLSKVKTALINILPDVQDIIIEKRRVYFVNKQQDKVLFEQLGSGYQSLITWVVDYAKRQFDRYPESSNPLAEPGIVLVDEIDLHLHPTWQRRVINFLRGLFPKTQFIVTAHSPLVVQSADDINVVVLHRDEETEEIKIEQPELTNFQGWSVEEILRDLMDAQVYSNKYLDLTQQFEQALQEDNYPKAKEAYEQLEKIVKSTATLKMFRIQMAGLTLPAND